MFKGRDISVILEVSPEGESPKSGGKESGGNESEVRRKWVRSPEEKSPEELFHKVIPVGDSNFELFALIFENLN